MYMLERKCYQSYIFAWRECLQGNEKAWYIHWACITRSLIARLKTHTEYMFSSSRNLVFSLSLFNLKHRPAKELWSPD